MSHTAVDQILEEVREKKKTINSTPLLERRFVSLDHDSKSSSNSDLTIRLVQWNVLAQGLCRSKDSFVLCPDQALDWSVRQNLILEELLTYKPDILCLQEVDFFKFLEANMLRAGYKGSFFPKPDSPCLYTKESIGPDGCAMFWNESKVMLMGIENLILQNDSNGRNTNQVAIVGKFRFKSKTNPENEPDFAVCTTHLKSKKHFHNQRSEQGQYLEKWLLEHCFGLPLIVCGDFNAEPTEKVISIFKTSGLGLSSSYALLSQDESEPQYTTWKVRGNLLGKQEEYCHTIDYLFFTPQYFNCWQLLAFPTGEEIGEGRLPSFSYPSDHLSLVGDFELKNSLQSPPAVHQN